MLEGVPIMIVFKNLMSRSIYPLYIFCMTLKTVIKSLSTCPNSRSKSQNLWCVDVLKQKQEELKGKKRKGKEFVKVQEKENQ